MKSISARASWLVRCGGLDNARHGRAEVDVRGDAAGDLQVEGNPTAYYRRAGGGSSMGAGLKLGAVRGEWVIDNNQGTGALFVRFGERF